MRPPKNFDNKMNRRKQLLPEVPQATAGDYGKVVKVGETGDYELGAGETLPEVTSSDNGSIVSVISGNWTKTSFEPCRFIVQNATGVVGVKSARFSINCPVRKLYWMGSELSGAQLRNNNPQSEVLLQFRDNNGVIYTGIILEYIAGSESTQSISAIVYSRGKFYKLLWNGDWSYTLTEVGTITYYEITVSGSSVSLPSGVTFAEVYALLQAGVDVKFTSGARVYSVTSVESTNIRAHWMSDLDLTSMEVYVINIASDGTGTVASATFSGS